MRFKKDEYKNSAKLVYFAEVRQEGHYISVLCLNIPC